MADAIIAEGKSRLEKVFAEADRSSASALQSLIVATFEVARLMRADKLIGTGNLLIQSLIQIGDAGTQAYPDWAAIFIAEAKKAAAQGDLHSDITPEEAGEAILVAVLGCQLLSDALGDDVLGRLARAWRVLITALVPPDSVVYFQEFLARIAAHYGQPAR